MFLLNDRLTRCAYLLRTRNRLAAGDVVHDGGVSLSTAARLLRQLEDIGLARRSEGRIHGRGRPQSTYELALPFPIAACYVDGSRIQVGVVEPDLLVTHLSATESRRTGDVNAQVKRVHQLIRSLDGFDRVGAVALSVNAVVIKGKSLASSVVPHAHTMLTRLLAERFDRPVYVSTAPLSSCVASQSSAYADAPNLLCYHVADGVSAHTQIEGRSYTGAAGLAGEIGHLSVESNGPLCGCGRRGCFETLVSGPSIHQRFIEALEESPGSSLGDAGLDDVPPRRAIQEIWEAWCAGDGLARGSMEPVLAKLAWGLAIAVNLYDPAVVTLSGYVFDGHDRWIDEVVRRARPQIMQEARRQLQFEALPIDPSSLLREVAVGAYFSNAVG